MAPETFTEHAEAPCVDSNTEDQMPRVGTTAASEVANDLTTADKPTAHKMPTAAPNEMPTTDDQLHRVRSPVTKEFTDLVEQNRQLERRLVAIEEAALGSNAKLARMHDEAHKYYGTLYTLLRHVMTEQKEKKPSPKVEEKIATLAEEIDQLRGSLKNIALGQKSTIDTCPTPGLPDASPTSQASHAPTTLVTPAHLQSVSYPLQQAASSYSASPVQFIHESQHPPHVVCQPIPVHAPLPVNYSMIAPVSPPQAYGMGNAMYAHVPQQNVFYHNY